MSKILSRTIIRNIFNVICLAAIITAVLSLGIASDSDSFIAGITGTPTTKAATSPTVVTVGASASPDGTATLYGNLSDPGSAASVTVSFEYGTTTSYGSMVAGVPATLTSAGDFSADLTGLTLDQTYHFRAKAVGDGTVNGTDATFTVGTPPAVTPPAVTTNGASGITTTSATLNGNLSGLGSASSVTVSFEYGTTTSYGATASGVPSTRTSAGAFTANLTGLASGQTYHFRAKAMGDETVYGNDVTFTTTSTLPEVTPPVVTTNGASGITDTSATINGNLSDPGSAASVTVSFEYGTTTSYGATAAGVPSTRTSAGAFTANLTGLASGQTYHFRAKAVGDGTVYGNDVTFTTTGNPPAVTPPAVTTNGASGITTTSATLNGNLSGLGSASSVTVSFEYGTTTSYGATAADVPSTRTSAGAFTANLTGLASGQTYHFRAKAVGDGTVYGNDATFTTTGNPPAVTPPVITTNGASGISTTSATLNGNLSGLGSASSVTVSFEYGTTASYGTTAAGVPATRTSAGAFTANLTGLASGQTYHFRAKAVGDGTVYGSDVTFTTTGNPPEVITNGASGITTTSATLNGNLSGLGSASSVTVSFEYGRTTGYGSTATGVPSTRTSAGAFTANLTGLTPGQTYHFRAKAVGDGTVYGSDVTFTTTGNPSEVITPEVITNDTSSITDTSATLNGNLSALGSASSITVSFEYGKTTSYGSAAAGIPPTLTSTGTFAADLTGLTPGQTYHFRTKAVGDGTVYGSDATFTTAPVATTESKSESNWPLIAGIVGGTVIAGLVVLFIFRRNIV